MQDLVVVGLCDANKLTVVHFSLHHSLVIQLLHRWSDSKTKKNQTIIKRVHLLSEAVEQWSCSDVTYRPCTGARSRLKVAPLRRVR